MTTDYQHSPEGQLADLGALGARSTMTYDGRSFLRKAEQPAFSIFEDGFESANFDCWIIGGGALEPGDDPLLGPGCFTPSPVVSTTATYGSEGQLYSLLRESGERNHVLYLSGRPVAQLKVPAAGAASFTYLTTDHLGTPVLAMNQAGASLWSGGFEPFGTDYNGAQAAGVFLRFPGQWDDPTWAGVGSAGLSYNLNRWYERGTGSYVTRDPIGLRAGGLSGLNQLFVYGRANTLVFVDPRGLASTVGCTEAQVSEIDGAIAEIKRALDKPNRKKDCPLCEDDARALAKHVTEATYYCALDKDRNLDRFDFANGGCGSQRNNKGHVDGKSIALLYPWVITPGFCTCLKNTIFHEATHNVMDTSDPAETNNAYHLSGWCVPCTD